MNCDEVKKSIQDYVTREVGPEERRLFDAHLVECTGCQRELALMTAVVSTLDHQPALEPGPGFSGKVLASLPRQRVFAPNPWWALALTPLLGGLVWLFRSSIEHGAAGLLGRSGFGSSTLPLVSVQQAGMAAAAVVGLGLLVATGAAAFCWRVYLRD